MIETLFLAAVNTHSLLRSALQLISNIQYKNHIYESGAFSGERVHTSIHVTHNMYCQVIV